MKDRLINFIKKPFIKNVIILISGTAAAQVIGFILTPIITRLYGPEAYGILGTFSAVVAIVTPLAALMYPVAIVLPKKDREAIGIIKLSLLCTVLFALVTAIMLAFFDESIISLFQIENVGSYLYLIPVTILFAGLLQIIEQWYIRKQQFNISAKATFYQATIVNGGKAGVGFFYPVAPVLVFFTAITQGLKAFLFLWFSRNIERRFLKEIINRDKGISIKKLAKKYRDFPFYRAPEALVFSVTQSLPLLMLTSFFGPVSTGFYSIGRTVLQLPIGLIGKAVGDVFYPRISEAAHNGENITKLIKKATFSLAVTGVIPFSLIILFGPWLFGFVFGADWVVAGEYARWMSLGLFFQFLRGPSVKALPVLSAQAFFLAYSVLTLIISVGFLAIGYYVFSSDIYSVALFGISGAILNAGLIVITLFISKKYDKKY